MEPPRLRLSWHSHQHKIINRFNYCVNITLKLQINHSRIKISFHWAACYHVRVFIIESLVVRHGALGHLEGFVTSSCIIPCLTALLMSDFHI